jgi:hypothetical protein
MRHRRLFTALLVLAVLVVGSVGQARAEQTLVFLRHGEKPAGGLGQLNCQGFNRALALPAVLLAKFGRPDILYAPSPAVKIADPAGSFYYDRPLATLEPLAVRLGLDIWSKYGYTDIASLQAALITPTKDDMTIFIAWEHAYLQKVVQNIMNSYGGRAVVPAWISGDFDSLYVVRVTYAGGTIRATFQKDSERLNGQPTTCAF